MFAVGLRQYPKSAAVLRILQPEGGLCPVIAGKADVVRHRLGFILIAIAALIRLRTRIKLTNGYGAVASNFRE